MYVWFCGSSVALLAVLAVAAALLLAAGRDHVVLAVAELAVGGFAVALGHVALRHLVPIALRHLVPAALARDFRSVLVVTVAMAVPGLVVALLVAVLGLHGSRHPLFLAVTVLGVHGIRRHPLLIAVAAVRGFRGALHLGVALPG